MNPISDTLLIRINGNHAEELVDQVAAETAFTLVVNNEVLVSLLCSPTELDSMAIGFLLSEGLLSRREDLKSVIVDDKSSTVLVNLEGLPEDWQDSFNKKTITSGCGGTSISNFSNSSRALNMPTFFATPPTMTTSLSPPALRITE